MQKIKTFLWFDNQAEEAANLYTSIFKNSRVLEVSRYGEGLPAPAGSVMTVRFELDGQEFIALNGGPTTSSPTPSRSTWSARTRPRSTTTTGTSLSTVVSRPSAVGSRTATVCPGRSSPVNCRNCWETRTRRRRSGPRKPCWP